MQSSIQIVTTHIDNIITGCACVQYGWRSHGMLYPALHTVFQSTVLAKVTYAAPAWTAKVTYAAPGRVSLTSQIGIALRPLSGEELSMVTAQDTTPTLSLLCDKVDQTIFDNTITNSTHPLHIFYPPKVEKHYSTRPRGHCYQLPRKTSVLDENNFFYRLLYRNILSFY